MSSKKLPPPIEQRITGLLDVAMLMHQSSSQAPSAQKGAEREVFMDYVLKEALPPTVRFGTGSVSDVAGNESGQLDIVLEGPKGISFSMPGVPNSRFYISNYVGAVVEVKSNITDQWDEALRTAAKLSAVRKHSGVKRAQNILDKGGSFGIRDDLGPEWQKKLAVEKTRQLGEQRHQIPLFVVSYKGWKRPETLKQKLAEASDVDGLFIIDSLLWARRRGSKISVTQGASEFLDFLMELLRNCEAAFRSFGNRLDQD